MQLIVQKLKNEGNRSSTRANYYSIWRSFNQFFVRLDTKPDNWEDRLVLFVGYLISQRHKSSTIKSYISAIKAVLKEDGEEINENTFLLKSLTKACKLVNDQVRTRLPIRKQLLKVLVDKIPKLFDKQQQPYLEILYKAVLVTAYFGLFRIGEVCHSQHAIKARDVHIGKNKKKLMFILHTSKTHWKNVKPQIVKINSADFDATGNKLRNKDICCQTASAIPFCPFKILNDYLSVRPHRKSDFEQFFVFRDRSPVMPSQMHAILKKLITIVGLDEKLYGFQSLRGGRASDLAALGLNISVIKFLGRWTSGAILTYIRA